MVATLENGGYLACKIMVFPGYFQLNNGNCAKNIMAQRSIVLSVWLFKVGLHR